MAIHGEVSPSAKALNEARDRLIRHLRGLGAGEELVKALEQFLDARAEFKRGGY